MKLGKKKVMIIGTIVLVLAAAVGVNAKMKGSANKETRVSVSEVLKKDIQSTLSLKAPLEGTESVEVVSRLHYEILSIDVKEGDKVEKDQVIALLDPTDLEEEIQKLRDNLELLQIQYKEGKASKNTSAQLAQENLDNTIKDSQRKYESALENYETAKTEYENTKVLFNAGIESQSILSGKENAFKEAKRVVDSFHVVNGKVEPTDAQLMEVKNASLLASNASNEKSIEIAKKELERKEKNLQDCRVKSSISGTVTRVNAKVGRFADEIDDKKPMFVIENIDNLNMIVDVSEYDIDKLEIGQSVQIQADILKGNTVEGVVSRISPTGEEKAGTNERVIPIQIDVLAQSKGLIAGINATAKIETARAENALVIPIEGLVDNNDDTYSVFVLKEGNIVEKVAVTIGVEDVLEIQIISDKIAEGDKVILNPDPTITDGMSVVVNE